MKRTTLLAATLTALSLTTSACARRAGTPESETPAGRDTPAGEVVISRGAARSTQRGPAEQFTGAVRVEMLFAATDSSRAAGASVSFEPGARTAWHRHPRGQVLIVTAGTGRVQRRGGPVEEIRAGDVVWTPPGVDHWHGAAPTTAMAHIAIQEHAGGAVVTWLEAVSDAQYAAPPR